jgi:hypothetical protein
MSDIETLKMALIGYEAERQKTEATMAAIRSQLGGRASAPSTTPTGAAKPKRKMSAAGKKAIAEAQRKRWAASKVQAEAATPGPAKPKRKLSAAAKANLVANLKRARAAKAAKAKAAAKTAAPARKKTTGKKAAVKPAPAKATKKAAATKKTVAKAKKTVVKKTAPVPTQVVPQTAN